MLERSFSLAVASDQPENHLLRHFPPSFFYNHWRSGKNTPASEPQFQRQQ